MAKKEKESRFADPEGPARARARMHADHLEVLKEAKASKPTEIKVLSNFHANRVEGRAGQFLTEDEVDLIGAEHVEQMHHEGLVLHPKFKKDEPEEEIVGDQDQVQVVHDEEVPGEKDFADVEFVGEDV